MFEVDLQFEIISWSRSLCTYSLIECTKKKLHHVQAHVQVIEVQCRVMHYYWMTFDI